MIRRISSRLRAVAWSAAAVAVWSSSGCSEGSADGLNRQAVHGKVTLDGAPLAKGVIAFDPADGSAGAAPAGGVIADGAYSIERATGPTPGKYKVSIRSVGGGEAAQEKAAPGMPPKKPAADPIPKQYNTASTLTAEVVSGGSTTADFALTTK
ncbi:hypothetical protein [Paludisphaera mucosa]|uniref:Carboxypeptidase regulatory-like domain-containing protein n=1 Tax=Paludisphaera mucosa TaxID=3030827 RepID=A0ABT6F3X7_9BACT|nr:hypothetical protein [Paludisphaera mucosa]MDG3002287.1 hypothetical protein [Paludisphaera mucosa]